MAQNAAPSTLDLPNPFTPLAFLPESDADKLSLMIHFLVTCLGIMIWDILNYIVEDYKVIFKRDFTWKTLVFIVARLSPLGFLIFMSLLFTAKLDHCAPIHFIWITFFAITRVSTSLLFYFRLCAVYNGNRLVIGFFTCTLLTVVAGATITYFSVASKHIGPTKYCVSLITSKSISLLPLTELVNDALTFLAMMYKLNVHATEPEKDNRSRWAFFRQKKDRFAAVLMHDSQIFYLVAFCMNAAKVIFFFIMSNPPDSPIRIVLMFPNVVVVNVIAVRVYRNMKLGRPGLFSVKESKALPSFSASRMRAGGDLTSRNAGEGGIPLAITIKQTTVASSDADGMVAKEINDSDIYSASKEDWKRQA